MLKVSVLILTKNPGDIFKQVLEAVRSQETPWDYEILVIDSGSTDGTVAFIKSFNNVRLHCVPSQDFGHGKTRNLGISLTSAPFVALLTHDAMPANKDWLKNLVAAMEQDASIAGAFGRHLAYEYATPFVKRDLQIHFDGFLQWPSVFKNNDPERYATDVGYRQILHYFSSNNSCIRRSVWEKTPYPDVNFAEDQFWAKTIIEAGYSKAYADDASVYHSHNYSILEMFRRSYDESLALKQLFGYELCPSLAILLSQILACSLRDVRYILSVRDEGKPLLWALKAPLLNAAKQIGYYVGNRSNAAPGERQNFLSLDEQLKKS